MNISVSATDSGGRQGARLGIAPPSGRTVGDQCHLEVRVDDDRGAMSWRHNEQRGGPVPHGRRSSPNRELLEGHPLRINRDWGGVRRPVWPGRPLTSWTSPHILRRSGHRGDGVGCGCWPFLVLVRSRFRWWRVICLICFSRLDQASLGGFAQSLSCMCAFRTNNQVAQDWTDEYCSVILVFPAAGFRSKYWFPDIIAQEEIEDVVFDLDWE